MPCPIHDKPLSPIGAGIHRAPEGNLVNRHFRSGNILLHPLLLRERAGVRERYKYHYPPLTPPIEGGDFDLKKYDLSGSHMLVVGV